MNRKVIYLLALGAMLSTQSGCETWQRVLGAQVLGIDWYWFV